MIKNFLKINIFIIIVIVSNITSYNGKGKLSYPEKGYYPRFFPKGTPKNEWYNNYLEHKFKLIIKKKFINNNKKNLPEPTC